MEETISLKDIYYTLKKRLNIIILLTVIAVAVSGVVSYFVLTPTYETSTQILVNQHQEKGQIDYNQVQTNVQMVNTYSTIIKSPTIMEKVIEQLHSKSTVDELNNQVTVNSEQNNQVFTVTVQDKDPAQAVKIANTIADVFQKEIPKIMKIDNVTILSKAVVKDDMAPVKPKPLLNMAIAGVVGLMVGVGLAFLLEYLDNTLKTEQDIENVLELPVLGTIPKMKAADEKAAKKVTVNQGIGSEPL
ncbi:YveK family protein [Fictibacillus gelatini]|uniref:YveK family protein n=1 Tax=Fictibacillus gelatini TaxID=225985 RepID=UPI0004228C60|nr:Wzz/FepE/Etk N-terminal domain-containing protein [Fictibacillus gelatini]